MSALQPLLPGARVLDLYAGSGALGLETLSRGAEWVTFVERAGGALHALRKNVQTLDAGRHSEIIRADALTYAASLGESEFDLALADPPYAVGAAALVELFLKRHFARWLWVEHRAQEVLPELTGARTRRYGDTALTSIPAPRCVNPRQAN